MVALSPRTPINKIAEIEKFLVENVGSGKRKGEDRVGGGIAFVIFETLESSLGMLDRIKIPETDSK